MKNKDELRSTTLNVRVKPETRLALELYASIHGRTISNAANFLLFTALKQFGCLPTETK